MSKNEYSCDCSVIHEQAVNDVLSAMPSKQTLDDLSAFFKVIGDNTRVRILWALSKDELCVCDIANILGMTKSAVSHQLSSLRNANLVKFRRDGKTVYYSLSDDHVRVLLSSGIDHVTE
jgi:DNA-binding transcriptional ArsR family regulator